MLARPTVRDVLTACAPGGDEAAWRAALRDEAHPTPWFVRVLIGVGAWVSAMLLALGVGLSGIGNDKAGLFVVGAIALAGGIALRWRARSDFLVQLALAASLGGRPLLYFAIADGHDAGVGVALVALLVETVTVVLYRDAVGRFLATLGACGAIVLFPFALDLDRDTATQVGVQLALVVLAGAASAVWSLQGRIFATHFGPMQEPVGLGLVAGLFGGLLTLTQVTRAATSDSSSARPLAYALSAGLALLVADVVRQATRDLGASPRTKALAYGGVAALAVLALRAPGLLAGVLVLALAIHRRSRALLAMAAAYLVVFGSWFYYDLDMTLLAKAGVLAASGALLLGMRRLLPRAEGA
jgi:GAF domain-containing protein